MSNLAYKTYVFDMALCGGQTCPDDFGYGGTFSKSLGFTVYFGGVSYTSVAASTGGFIAFGSVCCLGSQFPVLNKPAIAAVWTDLGVFRGCSNQSISLGASAAGSSEVDALIASKSPGFTSVGYYVATYRVSYYGTCNMLTFQIILTVDASGNTWAVIQAHSAYHQTNLGFTVYFGGVSYTSVAVYTSGYVALGTSSFYSSTGPRFPQLNKPAIAAVWADLGGGGCSNQAISHGASAVGSSAVDALIASKSRGFTSVGYYVATYRVGYYGSCDMLTFQIILTVDASGNTWAVIQYEGLLAKASQTTVAGINDGQGQCSTIYYGTANTEAMSNLANKTYVLDMGLCGGQTCSDDLCYIAPSPPPRPSPSPPRPPPPFPAGFIEVPNPWVFSFRAHSAYHQTNLGFTVYFGGVSYTSVAVYTSGYVALGTSFFYSSSGPQFPQLNKPAIAAVWADLGGGGCSNQAISHGASAVGSSAVDALIASKSPGFTSVGYYVATYRVGYYGSCDMLTFQIILTVDASGNTWAVIQYEGLLAKASQTTVAGINDGQGQCSTIYYGTANTEAMSNLANKTYVLDMGLCGGQTCSDDFSGPQFPQLNKPAIAAVWADLGGGGCSNQAISHGASAVGSSAVDALIASKSRGFTSVGYYVATYRVGYYGSCDMLTFQIILTVDASGNTWAVIQYEGLLAKASQTTVAGINDGQGQCSTTIYYGTANTEAMSNLANKTYVLDMGLCGGQTCSDDLAHSAYHQTNLGFTVYFGGVSYTSVAVYTSGYVALGTSFFYSSSGPQFPQLNKPAIAAVWADLGGGGCSNQAISHGASAVGSSAVDALIASKSPGFTSVGYYVATYRVGYYGSCDMLTFQIILTVDASGNTWAVIQYEGLLAKASQTTVAGINDGQGQCSTIYYGTANTEAMSNLANKTYVLDMGLCGGQTCSDDLCYIAPSPPPRPSPSPPRPPPPFPAGFIEVPNPWVFSTRAHSAYHQTNLGFTVYFGGVSYTSVAVYTSGYVALGTSFFYSSSGPQFPQLNKPAIAAVWADLGGGGCSNQAISHGASAVGSSAVDALIASKSPGFTSVGYYVATYRVGYYGSCDMLTFQIILTVDASGNTWAVIQYEGLLAKASQTTVAGINDGQGQCSTIYYGTANTEAMSNLANKTYVLDMGLCGGQTCSDDLCYIAPSPPPRPSPSPPRPPPPFPAGFIEVPNPWVFSTRAHSAYHQTNLGFTVYFGGVSYTSVAVYTSGYVALGTSFFYSSSGPQFPQLNKPAIAAVWADLGGGGCSNQAISHGASAVGSSAVDALIASKSRGFTSVGYYVATYRVGYYGSCDMLTFQIILTVDASVNTWAVIQYEGLLAKASQTTVAGINDGQGQCSTIYYGTANTEAMSNLANKTYVLDMGLCGGQTCSDDFAGRLEARPLTLPVSSAPPTTGSPHALPSQSGPSSLNRRAAPSGAPAFPRGKIPPRRLQGPAPGGRGADDSRRHSRHLLQACPIGIEMNLTLALGLQINVENFKEQVRIAIGALSGLCPLPPLSISTSVKVTEVPQGGTLDCGRWADGMVTQMSEALDGQEDDQFPMWIIGLVAGILFLLLLLCCFWWFCCFKKRKKKEEEEEAKVEDREKAGEESEAETKLSASDDVLTSNASGGSNTSPNTATAATPAAGTGAGSSNTSLDAGAGAAVAGEIAGVHINRTRPDQMGIEEPDDFGAEELGPETKVTDINGNAMPSSEKLTPFFLRIDPASGSPRLGNHAPEGDLPLVRQTADMDALNPEPSTLTHYPAAGNPGPDGDLPLVQQTTDMGSSGYPQLDADGHRCVRRQRTTSSCQQFLIWEVRLLAWVLINGGTIAGMGPDMGGTIAGMGPDMGDTIAGMGPDMGGTIAGMCPDMGESGPLSMLRIKETSNPGHPPQSPSPSWLSRLLGNTPSGDPTGNQACPTNSPPSFWKRMFAAKTSKNLQPGAASSVETDTPTLGDQVRAGFMSQSVGQWGTPKAPQTPKGRENPFGIDTSSATASTAAGTPHRAPHHLGTAVGGMGSFSGRTAGTLCDARLSADTVVGMGDLSGRNSRSSRNSRAAIGANGRAFNCPVDFAGPGDENGMQDADLGLEGGRDKGARAASRPMLRHGGFEGAGSGVTWIDVPNSDDDDSGPKVVQVRPNIKKPGLSAPASDGASSKSGRNWLAAGEPSQLPGWRELKRPGVFELPEDDHAASASGSGWDDFDGGQTATRGAAAGRQFKRTGGTPDLPGADTKGGAGWTPTDAGSGGVGAAQRQVKRPAGDKGPERRMFKRPVERRLSGELSMSGKHRFNSEDGTPGAGLPAVDANRRQFLQPAKYEAFDHASHTTGRGWVAEPEEVPMVHAAPGHQQLKRPGAWMGPNEDAAHKAAAAAPPPPGHPPGQTKPPANAKALNRLAGFVDIDEGQEDNAASMLTGPSVWLQKRGAAARAFKRPELQARNDTLDNAHMPAMAGIPTKEASAPAMGGDARNARSRFKRPGVDFIDSPLDAEASGSKAGPAPTPPAANPKAAVRAPQVFKWSNGLYGAGDDVEEDIATLASVDNAPPGLSPAEARRYQQARAFRHGQRENVNSHVADVDQIKLQAEAKRKSMLDQVKNKPLTSDWAHP
eukprot:gene21916-28960_t